MKAPRPGKLIGSTQERMSVLSDQKPGFDMQAQTYFDSLPQVLKAQIIQSGVRMTTREELEQYCRNALEKKADQGQ